jgi:hypothetical protein
MFVSSLSETENLMLTFSLDPWDPFILAKLSSEYDSADITSEY